MTKKKKTQTKKPNQNKETHNILNAVIFISSKEQGKGWLQFKKSWYYWKYSKQFLVKPHCRSRLSGFIREKPSNLCAHCSHWQIYCCQEESRLIACPRQSFCLWGCSWEDNDPLCPSASTSVKCRCCCSNGWGGCRLINLWGLRKCFHPVTHRILLPLPKKG